MVVMFDIDGSLSNYELDVGGCFVAVVMSAKAVGGGSIQQG